MRTFSWAGRGDEVTTQDGGARKQQTPGRLTPAKLHIAPHLCSKDAHSRLAPSHSQKASSFSWNCLRNCIATVATEISFLTSASRKFLRTDLLVGLGAVTVRICHLMYSTYLLRAIHSCARQAPNLAVSQHEKIRDMILSKSLRNAQIVGIARCSMRSIRTIRTNLRCFGTSKAPRTGSEGPEALHLPC